VLGAAPRSTGSARRFSRSRRDFLRAIGLSSRRRPSHRPRRLRVFGRGGGADDPAGVFFSRRVTDAVQRGPALERQDRRSLSRAPAAAPLPAQSWTGAWRLCGSLRRADARRGFGAGAWRKIGAGRLTMSASGLARRCRLLTFGTCRQAMARCARVCSAGKRAKQALGALLILIGALIVRTSTRTSKRR